jgi:apolipoprotein N-acyltransferase
MSQLKQLDFRNILLALISGIMLTAAFPKTGCDYFAWFALVPLLLTINHTKSVFLTGCLTGFVHQMTLVYWLVTAMHVYGNLPFFTSIPLLILLCMVLSIYTGIFCVLVKRLCTKPWHLIWAPFFWVSLEYARSLTQFAFPWELIGYSQYLKLPLIQIADITGVYGISWLIVLFNVAIACFMLYTTRQSWNQVMVSNRLVYVFLGSVILFFVVFLSYGLVKIYDMNQSIQTFQNQMKIAVIQGNINQSVKWDEKYRKQTIQKYIIASLSDDIRDADLIVWPETAVPIYIQQTTALSQKLRSFIDNQTAAFLIGGLRYDRSEMGQWKFYNSAFLLEPKKENWQTYDKSHLVPYGEYIPFQTVFPFLKRIVQGVGSFSEGTAIEPLRWDQWSIGPQICYEILFPTISRILVQRGADVLVNITNDAWYGHSSAPYQHYSMIVFRAIENKRSLARAANTGISGFVNPYGKIISASEIFTDDSVAASLPVLSSLTFYCQYGDIFAIFCCLVLAISVILNFLNQKRFVLNS